MCPSDIVRKFRDVKKRVDKSKLIYPDSVDDVPVDLLYKACENVAYDKAFAGSDRGTAQGRARDSRY